MMIIMKLKEIQLEKTSRVVNPKHLDVIEI